MKHSVTEGAPSDILQNDGQVFCHIPTYNTLKYKNHTTYRRKENWDQSIPTTLEGAHWLTELHPCFFILQIVSTREDTKSAIGSLLQVVQKYCLVLFFPSLPLAQTQNLGPVCYAYFGCFIDPKRHILHTQSVYNKTQNLCLGSTKLCLVMTRHTLVVWLGSQGKKETDNTFVLSTIMTYFWFNILPLKAPKVKNKSGTCAFSILHYSGFWPLPCLEDKFSLEKRNFSF